MEAAESGPVRCEKDSDPCNIFGMTNSTERRLGDGRRLEVSTENASRLSTLSISHTGIDGVYPNFFRSQLLRKYASDPIHRAALRF
jgi:hypothetical protein